MAPESSNTQQYPLYETTFTLNRLSPLYIGSETSLDNNTLQTYARQLRDVLAGDVLRGVRIGMSDDSSMARAGALQSVTWRLLPEEDMWRGADETQFTAYEDTTMSLTASRGILVTIAYEKGSYTAVLLRDTQGDGEESMIGVGLDEYGFQSFPLLLTKMPIGLRDPFTNFLATTFDARVSALHLPSKTLTTAFEQYAAYICVDEDGDPLDAMASSRALRTIIGLVTVSVGFDTPGNSSALKTIDINIAREDIPRIISSGKKLESATKSPFMDGLSIYVKSHMALDLNHKLVNITRISCDAFTLATEGKAKFPTPYVGNDGESPQRRATRRLINSLIATSKGGVMTAGEGT